MHLILILFLQVMWLSKMFITIMSIFLVQTLKSFTLLWILCNLGYTLTCVKSNNLLVIFTKLSFCFFSFNIISFILKFVSGEDMGLPKSKFVFHGLFFNSGTNTQKINRYFHLHFVFYKSYLYHIMKKSSIYT